MQTIIVVLGYANNARGGLHIISRERADRALELAKEHAESLVVATGGFSKRWNRSDVAHGEHLRRYMVKQGLPSERFLGVVESAYTRQDASMTKELIAPLGEVKLIVVTSDFHQPRAQYLFEGVFANSPCQLEFVPSKPSTLWTAFLAWLFWQRESVYLKRLKAGESIG